MKFFIVVLAATGGVLVGALLGPASRPADASASKTIAPKFSETQASALPASSPESIAPPASAARIAIEPSLSNESGSELARMEEENQRLQAELESYRHESRRLLYELEQLSSTPEWLLFTHRWRRVSHRQDLDSETAALMKKEQWGARFLDRFCLQDERVRLSDDELILFAMDCERKSQEWQDLEKDLNRLWPKRLLPATDLHAPEAMRIEDRQAMHNFEREKSAVIQWDWLQTIYGRISPAAASRFFHEEKLATLWSPPGSSEIAWNDVEKRLRLALGPP